MFCSSLSLLSFTIMQFSRCATFPIIYSVKCNHLRQRQLCSSSCDTIISNAAASVLYTSVRFFGNTGMAGSITSESISLSSQGCKLELVREMPPILAAEMESNHVKEEESKINNDVAQTQYESKGSADSSSSNTKEKEETIIDFTQPEKVALLQQHRLEKETKMFANKSIHYYKMCLTEVERRNLVNMIYKTHYEPMNSEEVGSVNERVSESAELLWDEACMELKEITIWACKVEFEEEEEEKQQHSHQEDQREKYQQEEHEETTSCTKDKTENICSSHNNIKTFANVTDNKQNSAKHETADKHQESIRKRIKRAVLERVDLHKPLSYIIGNQLFYDCDICCKAPLLCPRPETEMWVHWYVQQHLKPVLRSWKLQQTQKVMWQAKKESGLHRWPSLLRLSKWTEKHKNTHDDEKDQHSKADKEESCKSESASALSPSTVSNDGANMIRVLDMCCGTGCVGVAIAKHIPTAHITAVDIDQQAVELTAKNAKLNHITADRFHVMTSNLFECFLEPLHTLNHECSKHKLWSNQNSDGAQKLNCDDNNTTTRRVASEYIHYFDALVCNPPYILPNEYDTLAPSVRLWESRVALVGDTDRASRQYMYFKEILEYGAQLLKDATHRLEYMRDVPNIVIEVGLQAELVASMMERSGLYDEVEIHLDMAQRQRWISALSK